ncbi:MAG: TonB-dependent receptor [Cytophagaceae bacterium]|nr:TonB-dependent receptor [Cytophagaceae bacterium]
MKYIYILVCLIFSGSVFAQLTQNIRGKIVDKEAKYGIPGVSVMVVGMPTLGNVTDEEGNFKINKVPVGRQTLKVTYVGYKELLINNIVVDAGKEVILNLEMEEAPMQLNEVIVKARRNGEASNEMATISARQFSVEETNRYAGSRGEPARMASNFAGVQGADDSRSDIVIRGNSPSGVLWRVEGVSIPNPNHFAIPGTSGGPVSIINNKYLTNSDFFTGAFPAEFGNSISGVFDLKLRNGNNQSHEMMAQFGFLGTEAMAEGPLNKDKGSSYLLTYRYANLWLFNKIGIDIGTQAVPKYQDGFFRFNFPKKNGASVALWGFAGNSTVDIMISEQTTEDRNIFGSNDRDQYFSSRIGVAGLTYSKPLNKTTFLKATLAASTNAVDANHDYVLFNYDDQGNPKTMGNKFIIDQIIPIMDYTFKENKLHGVISINKKFSTRSTRKAGLNLDLNNFYSYDSARTVVGYPKLIISSWQNRWKSDDYYVTAQPYAQWKYTISPTLSANIGVTGLFSTINKNSVSPIEPRAGLNWDVAQGQKINLATGLHSNLQSNYTYFYGNESLSGRFIYNNRDMGLTKSWHFVAGYNTLLGKNMRLMFETYYQYLFNIPVEKSPSSFSMVNTGAAFSRIFPEKLVNEGTGRNYGVELTLEKFFSQGYYFLVTSSLFDAKYKGSDGVLRNSDFNGKYAGNFLFAKEFKLKRSSIDLGAKWTMVGGRWYGPVDEAKTIAAQEIIYKSETRNSLQFDPYRRLDLKVDYKINRKGLTHTIAVDLVNILGIQNILSMSYAPQPDGSFIKTEYQLGFLPVFFYRVDF